MVNLASFAEHPIARRSPIQPAVAELVGVGLLVAFYAVADNLLGEDAEDATNIVGAIWLTAVLALGAALMMRADSSNIWAALFWFRVSTAIYFGFGSLVPFFVNEVSRLYIDVFYPFLPSELVKLNTIVAWCVLIVLASVFVVERLTPPIQHHMPENQTASIQSHRLNTMRRLGLYFLLFGGALKYLVIFPHAMGWITSTMDGIVSTLSALLLAGIYLLTLWSLNVSRAAFVSISAIVIIEMGAGLLLLTKSETLMPLLVYLIALLAHRISFSRMCVAVAAMVLFFNLLSPLVSYSRDKYYSATGGDVALGITERIGLIGSYFDHDQDVAQQDELQVALLRLSYVNAGTFAMSRYDLGMPGDSLDNVLATFVPRFLWPNKPIFNIGQEFAAMATGSVANNSVSPGLFAEAYWNFGWYGIPLLMVPLGAILALFSRYAFKVTHRGDWIYMPILFIGMKMGIGSDGHYVASVVGTTIIAVGLHWAIYFTAGTLAPAGLGSMQRQG